MGAQNMKKNDSNLYFRDIFTMNADKPLHHNFVFWLPIIIFVPLGLLLSFPMWCLCIPSAENYKAILEALGLPVFVASLSLPFTIAIGRFHGSAQRAKANQLAEKNMAFNHYFDHRNHFFKFISEMKLPKPFCDFVTIEQPSNLYAIIFPLNKIDNQNMSAQKDVVTDAIAAKVLSIHNFTNPLVKKVSEGKDPFGPNEVFEFLNKIGAQFGLAFSERVVGCIAPQKARMGTTIDMCFQGILTTIQEAGTFSHTGFGGWTVPLALDPLLKSTQNSPEFRAFSDEVDKQAIYGADDSSFSTDD
jgi:hypothetical protein